MRASMVVIFVIPTFVFLSVFHAVACGIQSEAVEGWPILASGYGVHSYFTDSSLHQRWVVVVDCRHPEHPASLIAIPARVNRDVDNSAPVAGPEVLSGMQVRLWSSGNGAEMQFTGVAMEAAYVGKMVRVRTGFRGTVLSGVVRGPGSVELIKSRDWKW